MKKNVSVKGVGSLIIGLSVLGAVSSVSAATNKVTNHNYSDIQQHWAKDAIMAASDKGYVDGYEDGTFRPDQQITRAEFTKLAITALNISVKTVNGADWYKPYVSAAQNKEFYKVGDFVSGNEDAVWNTAMNREEMARMSTRAAGQNNNDEKKWMYLATKAGLIQGVDDTGSLDVDGTTTRAQAVTIIERILAVKAGKALEADKHAVSRAEVLWHGTNIFTMLPRYFAERTIGLFDINKFKWSSADGNFQEEVIEYVVVDNEDPNDPFKDEVKGLVFSFSKYSNGNKTSEYKPAPEKSFVVYTKTKQTYKSAVPAGIYLLEGGYISTDPIVTEDAIYGNEHGDDWEEYLYNKETDENILTIKAAQGDPLMDWNVNRFGLPRYASDMPKSGGAYTWVSADVFPKGNLFSNKDKFIRLRFTPNIAYASKVGPKGSNLSIAFSTDYNKSN